MADGFKAWSSLVVDAERRKIAVDVEVRDVVTAVCRTTWLRERLYIDDLTGQDDWRIRPMT